MEKKLIKSIFLRFKTNNIRLKIQRWQHRAGSTPAAGIMIKTRFLSLVFFIIYTFFGIKVTKNYYFIITHLIYLLNLFVYLDTNENMYLS